MSRLIRQPRFLWLAAAMVTAITVGSLAAVGAFPMFDADPGTTHEGEQRPVALQLPPVARQVWQFPSLVPYGVSIAESGSVEMGTGEIQSTVVPPEVTRHCYQGRLLISDDGDKESGRIALLDLDNLSGAPRFTDVPPLPDVDNSVTIASNDHDLLALPNGDVVLIKMGRSREAIHPKPVWFDHAYKLPNPEEGVPEWGPGARSKMFVWRSENCGDSFRLVSSIDTAFLHTGHGPFTGGLPQPSSSTIPPGSEEQPIWSMGGTDGPLARVDPETGQIYLTIALFGNLPSSSEDSFAIGGQALNVTAVMRSDDGGSSWTQVQTLPFRGWRLDVLPRSGNRLAFAHELPDPGSSLRRAFVIPEWPLSYHEAPEPAGWNQSWKDHSLLYKSKKDKTSTDTMATNVPYQTILARSPSGQNLLVAHAATIGENGDGYRLYMQNGGTSWLPFAPIAPQTPNPDSFVLHLTGVDPGRGPIFFYWYDVEAMTKRVTIRGRLITRDNQATADFSVSRDGSVSRSFDVSTDARWYGDYHTAGGYVAPAAAPDWSRNTFHYFPVWVEPDGTTRFARVVYKMPITISAAAAESLGYRISRGQSRMIMRGALDISVLGVEPPPEEVEHHRDGRVVPK
jgi:hypothetical protein